MSRLFRICLIDCKESASILEFYAKRDQFFTNILEQEPFSDSAEDTELFFNLVKFMESTWFGKDRETDYSLSQLLPLLDTAITKEADPIIHLSVEFENGNEDLMLYSVDFCKERIVSEKLYIIDSEYAPMISISYKEDKVCCEFREIFDDDYLKHSIQDRASGEIDDCIDDSGNIVKSIILNSLIHKKEWLLKFYTIDTLQKREECGDVKGVVKWLHNNFSKEEISVAFDIVRRLEGEGIVGIRILGDNIFVDYNTMRFTKEVRSIPYCKMGGGFKTLVFLVAMMVKARNSSTPLIVAEYLGSLHALIVEAICDLVERDRKMQFIYSKG